MLFEKDILVSPLHLTLLVFQLLWRLVVEFRSEGGSRMSEEPIV